MREVFGRDATLSFRTVKENTFNEKNFVQIPYDKQPPAHSHLLLFLDRHSKKMLPVISLGVLYHFNVSILEAFLLILFCCKSLSCPL